MKKTCLGIWIDHSQAKVLVAGDNEDHAPVVIPSLVEPRHRMTGQTGVPLPGHLGCNTESHDRNRREQQLNRFYDRVIEQVPENASVLVMGPGEAKDELLARLNEKFSWRKFTVLTESTSKLTNRQMADHLRSFATSGSIS